MTHREFWVAADHAERARKCLAVGFATSFAGEREAAFNRAWAIVMNNNLTPSDFDFPPTFVPYVEPTGPKYRRDIAALAVDFLGHLGCAVYRATGYGERPRRWIVPNRLHLLSDYEVEELAIERGMDDPRLGGKAVA